MDGSGAGAATAYLAVAVTTAHDLCPAGAVGWELVVPKWCKYFCFCNMPISMISSLNDELFVMVH
jgi:hypothetical protein